MIDPQGRRVRRMHPRRVDEEESPIGEMKQKTLWDDMTTALPEHMQVSFQQRRHMILGDCHQLKTDVDSYNENYNDSEPIQMSFEFTEDLIEMEMPPDYPDSEDDDFDSEE